MPGGQLRAMTALERDQDVRLREHDVDERLGLRRVPAFPADRQVQLVGRRHERAGAHADDAGGQLRRDVLPEHPHGRADAGHLAQHAGLDHGIGAAGDLLLAGLEDEPDRPGQVRAGLVQHPRRAEQARRVDVVPAGVHHARRACSRSRGPVASSMGSASMSARSATTGPGPPADDVRHDARPADALDRGQPDVAQHAGDERGRLVLGERQLGVLVEVPAPRDRLVVGVGGEREKVGHRGRGGTCGVYGRRSRGTDAGAPLPYVSHGCAQIPASAGWIWTGASYYEIPWNRFRFSLSAMFFRSCCLLLLLAAPGLATAQAAQDITLVAPDGQSVLIDRDDYGVPHISAPTERALFYGQGFAIAQDRLFQMETFWRTATGRLAELQGAAALTQDQQIRTVYYTPAERAAQFAALSAPVRTMIDAYIAGINAYADSAEARPAVYKPYEYTVAPLNAGPIERWDRDKLVAVMQFFMRRFGEIGGQELTRMAELDANGAAWFEANRPVNDPAAPTTISNTAPPAMASLNAGPGAAAAQAAYTDLERAFARAGSAEMIQQREASDALLSGLGVPLKFGSFAATVSPGLSSKDAMLLGAPQMGAPAQNAKAVTSEVLLVFPGGQHLRGMTVPGIPGVIIGASLRPASDFAWTLTTGYTDNVDTYLFQPVSQGTYRYAGQTKAYTVIPETFRVRGQADVSYTHLRTEKGPVYLLNAQTGASYQYAFWNRELDMVEAFYDVWHGTTLTDFEAAARRVTMSFNLFYADSQLNTAYWHVGRYPQRPGNQDPRLPARMDGSGEWVGIVPFEVQPQERNPAKGYFVNWNNKPAPWWNQGDNQNWRPGLRSYDGVKFLEASLRAAAPDVEFSDLQELTRVVRSNGTYNEYPGTYQQVISFSGTQCTNVHMETVVPPGQSGFVNAVGMPSPNFADQWALYQSSAGTGPILMKDVSEQLSVCTSGEGGTADAAFGLAAPSPNPASGRVGLRVTMAAPADVRVSVLDALGREVAVLHDGALAAGETTLALDARALAPGVYVVRATGAGQVASRRVVVAR